MFFRRISVLLLMASCYLPQIVLANPEGPGSPYWLNVAVLSNGDTVSMNTWSAKVDASEGIVSALVRIGGAPGRDEYQCIDRLSRSAGSSEWREVDFVSVEYAVLSAACNWGLAKTLGALPFGAAKSESGRYCLFPDEGAPIDRRWAAVVALKKNPGCVDAWQTLGWEHFSSGTSATFNLATKEGKMGDPNEKVPLAIKALQEAVRLKKDAHRAWADLIAVSAPSTVFLSRGDRTVYFNALRDSEPISQRSPLTALFTANRMFSQLEASESDKRLRRRVDPEESFSDGELQELQTLLERRKKLVMKAKPKTFQELYEFAESGNSPRYESNKIDGCRKAIRHLSEAKAIASNRASKALASYALARQFACAGMKEEAEKELLELIPTLVHYVKGVGIAYDWISPDWKREVTASLGYFHSTSIFFDPFQILCSIERGTTSDEVHSQLRAAVQEADRTRIKLGAKPLLAKMEETNKVMKTSFAY